MSPDELRNALFENRGERPESEDHTHLCLHCGSLEESSCSACDEADAYFLSPQILSALEDLAADMATSREDALRGLLAVALATIERGGMATHTRAVAFLRDLELSEAAKEAPPMGPGPRGLVEETQGAAAKPD